MGARASRQAKLASKARYAIEAYIPRYSRECARIRAELLRVENGHDPLPEFAALAGTQAIADLAIASGLRQDPYEYRESDHGKWLKRQGYYYSPCEAVTC